MTRHIGFRRLRLAQPTDDPITPGSATTVQPAPCMSQLPQVTDVAEGVLNRSEREFGRQSDGSLLDRFALEAVIDALSSQSPALEARCPDQPLRKRCAHTERNAA